MTTSFRVLTALVLGTGCLPALYAQTLDQRQAEVARRGAHVMPFDLQRTQHIFSKTAKGGIQQVRVRDSSEQDQINLIRQHLSSIASAFSAGNYSGPMHIHGADMPGLALLRQAKPGDIRIDYQELTDGAQITYSSAQEKYVEAIHQWFDAQLSDHGHHASGHLSPP